MQIIINHIIMPDFLLPTSSSFLFHLAQPLSVCPSDPLQRLHLHLDPFKVCQLIQILEKFFFDISWHQTTRQPAQHVNLTHQETVVAVRYDVVLRSRRLGQDPINPPQHADATPDTLAVAHALTAAKERPEVLKHTDRD